MFLGDGTALSGGSEPGDLSGRYGRRMPLNPGDKAPALKLTDQAGNTVQLKDFQGQKVFIFFHPKADTSATNTQ